MRLASLISSVFLAPSRLGESSSSLDTAETRSVAIIGGGLAGLAAAAALCQRGFRVELFEARRSLGGRAGSFRDAETGELIDHCQHVSMGCCTNLADFSRRTGIAEFFARHRTLYFYDPDGRRCDLRAALLLPAPLHLLPSLLGMRFLTLRERLGVARALVRLANFSDDDLESAPTMGEWLRRQNQSEQAIRRFWSVVLVSALGESVERVSVAAARKVFVDGFMTSRDAYAVLVPTNSLGELYDRRVADCLREHGVMIHLQSPIAAVCGDGGQASGVRLADGSEREFDFVVVAVTWRRAAELVAAPFGAAIPELATLDQIQPSPITSLHLWFDRPITPLPHAVLVDRLSQWVFRRGCENPSKGYYYQVVISGSRALRFQARDDILAEVLDDLHTVWPQAQDAALLRWRMITEHEAVFAALPGVEKLRPAQQTAVKNLMLAGDWTRTGWPPTMEGAVRSGYLAAEAILRAIGRPERILALDLPRSWLARILIPVRR